MRYSIVDYTTVQKNSDFRLDSEYYHPDFLYLEAKINNYNNQSFGSLVNEVRCGPFGSTVLCDTYSKTGVIVARPFNLINYSLERDNLVYIGEKECKEKKLKLYNEGDVFFSRVGDVRCGIVPKFENKITISPNIIAVKVDPLKINPYYATIFFNSVFGIPQIKRGLKVVAQPTIQTDLISKLRIVLLSNNFQGIIEKLFKQSLHTQDKAKTLYSQAEQMLLAELQLSSWKPVHHLSFVKNYSDTQSDGRIDAEYFQPMYEEVISEIYKYEKGYGVLGDLVKVSDRNFTPSDDVVYKYIELSNISTNGNITGFTEALGRDLPTRARQIVNKGDVIISSIEGSLESIALINGPLNNALCSTGFYVVNSKVINSETLLVFLKSIAGQLQLKKGCSGTILTAISKDELSHVVIPKIGLEAQMRIKEKIDEMYRTREISTTLLDIAKRGVELAIEQDEESAEVWITGRLKDISEL